MRAAYVVATEFAEFDGRPAEKRFREVSDEDPMATQQGPVVRPLPPTTLDFEPYVDAAVAAQFLPLARRRARAE